MNTLNRKIFSYTIRKTDVLFNIVTPNYDKFDKMMPYIIFDGMFMESFPMQTSFTAPKDRLNDAKATLEQNGYVQRT
jgi:hypothetical protein